MFDVESAIFVGSNSTNDFDNIFRANIGNVIRRIEYGNRIACNSLIWADNLHLDEVVF